MIYVHWHTSPDTDSILSSIVWTQYLNDTWKEAKTIALWEINNETKFILNELNIKEPEIKIELPKGSDIFLIDHNDAKQSIPNRENYNIVWLIDHHSFGNFSTNNPLFVRMDVVGCSSTILFDIFRENNYSISVNSAKMMISAIVSDTLLFKSPTTTDKDIETVKALQIIAWVDDLDNYAWRMFDAKSNLWDIEAEKLVQIDYKKFEVGNKTLAVWVLETTNPDYGINRKDEILEAMKNIKKTQDLDFLIFCIIDILNEKNITITNKWPDQDMVSSVFNIQFKDDITDLWNRVSRKKQILPQLKEYIVNM